MCQTVLFTYYQTVARSYIYDNFFIKVKYESDRVNTNCRITGGVLRVWRYQIKILLLGRNGLLVRKKKWKN